MAGIEERGMHAHGDAVVDALGGADQLQPESEVARVGDVLGGDLLDPLVDHLVEVDRRGERQPGEDRHLRGGVAAGDVVGRVGLGVAELLRAGQGALVGEPAARHLGEDEVRRAVDDPVDPLHVRGGERFLQHPDDRHDAGHRALEAQLDPVLARAVPQLLAVRAQYRRPRRRACLPHRPQDVVARRREPADEFNDEIGAVQQFFKIPPGAGQDAADRA